MRHPRPVAVSAFAVAMTLLAGCGAWLGGAEEPPLPGKRLAVLAYDTDLEPDARIAALPVTLPAAFRNPRWSQAGGSALHAVGHVEGPTAVRRSAWDVDIGNSGGGRRPLMSGPVIDDGRVFTMDSRFNVSAYSADRGRKLWRVELDYNERDWEAFGGGLAVAGGRLYVTAGFGAVVALNPESGDVLWQTALPAPVRSAPLAVRGELYVVTMDNQLIALDAASGERRWRHAGFAEMAMLLGAAAPAAVDDTVIVPYSSGEIFALRTSNGQPVWSDNLAAVRRVDAASSLADIRALPVTDGSTVYAISHSGRTVAINLRSGVRDWERNVGGVRTPWLAGDWLFMVTNEALVLCISRKDGRIRWIAQLDRYRDLKDMEDPIHWYGPLAMGGRLYLFGSHGRGMALDPADGAVIDAFRIPKKVMAVAVADGTLYLQTDDADLYAYR